MQTAAIQIEETAAPFFGVAGEVFDALADLAGVIECQADELADAGIAFVPELTAALAALAKARGAA